MKRKILAIAVLLPLSGSAFAEGAYVGAGVLEGHASIPSATGTYSGYAYDFSGDKTRDTGFNLFGGYNFTQNFGVEVGYNYLGNSYSIRGTFGGLPVTSSGMKVYNYYAALTGTLPLSNGFALFAKAGVVRNHMSMSSVCVSSTCVDASSSDNRTQFMFGAGASYAITTNWAAQLEYQNYGKVTQNDVWGTGNSDAAKAYAISLSAKYSF